MTISPMIIGAVLDDNKIDPPKDPNPDLKDYYDYTEVYIFFISIYSISIVLYCVIWFLDRKDKNVLDTKNKVN